MATPLKRDRKNWKGLAREKARLGALRVGRVEYCAQWETNWTTSYMETRASLVGAMEDDWLPGQRHPQEKLYRPRWEGRNERAWKEYQINGSSGAAKSRKCSYVWIP